MPTDALWLAIIVLGVGGILGTSCYMRHTPNPSDRQGLMVILSLVGSVTAIMIGLLGLVL